MNRSGDNGLVDTKTSRQKETAQVERNIALMNRAVGRKVQGERALVRSLSPVQLSPVDNDVLDISSSGRDVILSDSLSPRQALGSDRPGSDLLTRVDYLARTRLYLSNLIKSAEQTEEQIERMKERPAHREFAPIKVDPAQIAGPVKLQQTCAAERSRNRKMELHQGSSWNYRTSSKPYNRRERESIEERRRKCGVPNFKNLYGLGWYDPESVHNGDCLEERGRWSVMAKRAGPGKGSWVFAPSSRQSDGQSKEDEAAFKQEEAGLAAREGQEDDHAGFVFDNGGAESDQSIDDGVVEEEAESSSVSQVDNAYHNQNEASEKPFLKQPAAETRVKEEPASGRVSELVGVLQDRLSRQLEDKKRESARRMRGSPEDVRNSLNSRGVGLL